MQELTKVTVIPWFHNKGNKGKLSEHNSPVEANTSTKAEHSFEEKISETEFLSEQSTAEEFQLLPSLFPV